MLRMGLGLNGIKSAQVWQVGKFKWIGKSFNEFIFFAINIITNENLQLVVLQILS